MKKNKSWGEIIKILEIILKRLENLSE